jgi:trehalose 6-phosphate phosphatase
MMPIDTGAPEGGAAPEFWDWLGAALVRHRKVFVFASLDSLLTDASAETDGPGPDPKVKTALRRLCRQRRVSLAVLSGRPAAEMAALIGLPITYAGHDGLEIQGPDVDVSTPRSHSLRQAIPALCAKVSEAVRHIPGLIVESCGLLARVHYSGVPPERVTELREVMAAFAQTGPYQLRTSDCAMELRPQVKWAKGEAISWLLQRSGAVSEQAVCIGEDASDEELFQYVPGTANVRIIGTEAVSTAAPYSVHRSEFAGFLNGITDVADGITQPY